MAETFVCNGSSRCVWKDMFPSMTRRSSSDFPDSSCRSVRLGAMTPRWLAQGRTKHSAGLLAFRGIAVARVCLRIHTPNVLLSDGHKDILQERSVTAVSQNSIQLMSFSPFRVCFLTSMVSVGRSVVRGKGLKPTTFFFFTQV